jgi:hypothetical protein
MSELHVVVVGIVIFNILELTMEIVPNFPTIWTPTSYVLSLGEFCCVAYGATGFLDWNWLVMHALI